MKSPSLSCEKLHGINLGKLSLVLWSTVVVTSILGFFILYSPNPFKVSPKHDLPPHQQQHTLSFQHPNGDGNCELFKGHWIPDMNGSAYTNWSCKTIPESKNCFKNGRKNGDFVNWRWKPDECELPRFDPKMFLRILRGKKMAFIGDSVARNQLESLLCLLSQAEIPTDIYKDSEDRFRSWYFPHHDFTLMILWSKFLVSSEERFINSSNTGIFDLQIDRVDEKWATKLPTLDYAIISDAHWFFRKIYLLQGKNITGCVFCNEPNITDRGLGHAVRLSFRSALDQIIGCDGCKGMLTFLRTFSPAHFENGSWDDGGRCNRTSPLNEDEINTVGVELELRRIQVEEIERARKRGEKSGKRFESLDVTRAMLMRPDGHPGSYWGNKWMKGYDDCVHWCLPGPIDTWNDLLMAMLRREAGLSLDLV